MWTAKKLLMQLGQRRGHARLEDLEPDQGQWSDVLRALQILKSRGLAETIESGRYRLTDDGRKLIIAQAAMRVDGAARQKRRTIRERVWWIIRKDRKVSIPGILSVIANEPERQYENIRDYIAGLVRGGILSPLPRRGGERRFILINDPGPLAPVLRRGGVIHDPNSGQDIVIREAVK